MKGSGDKFLSRELNEYSNPETRIRNTNSLLSDILEKEEEITLYKERLKELETAFCFNLEIISERDLELSILEKQLTST